MHALQWLDARAAERNWLSVLLQRGRSTGSAPALTTGLLIDEYRANEGLFYYSDFANFSRM